MWNAVSENEYNYVRSLEEKNQRIRLLNGLGSAALLLALALLLTGFSQTRAAGALKQRDALEPFLALFDPGAVSGLSLEEKLRNLKHGFYIFYGIECVLAAAGYVCYCRSILSRNRAYLDHPMIVQRAVCTAKREIFGRGCRNAYIDVETPAGETIENVFVPWISSREMGRGTPVLITVGKGGAEEDQEFRAYPAELHCKDIYKR